MAHDRGSWTCRWSRPRGAKAPPLRKAAEAALTCPSCATSGGWCTCRAAGGQGAVHAIAGGGAGLRERARSPGWGAQRDLPARHDDGERWDAQGQLVVPGLVDAHTHLAFGGWRADDFVARVRGESYQQIARRGGGILSTVRKTRARGHRGAVRPLPRLPAPDAGPGRDHRRGQERLRPGRADRGPACWRCTRRWTRAGPQRLVPTYLGAHVVPPELPRSGGRLRGPGRAGHRPGGRRGAGPLRRRVRRGGGVHRRPRPGGWRRRRARPGWA